MDEKAGRCEACKSKDIDCVFSMKVCHATSPRAALTCSLNATQLFNERQRLTALTFSIRFSMWHATGEDGAKTEDMQKQ